MMYKALAVLVCTMSAAPLFSQTLSLMNGTWVSARFMEGLKRSRSVAWTMQSLPDSFPLWAKIDTSNNSLHVVVGYDFDRADTLKMFQSVFGELGQRWAIGKSGQPMWMVNPDVQFGQYISLHWLDSLDANPIVLGKLPSRNSDPSFLLHRMILSSMVFGRWRDSTGAEVEFKPNATVLWEGKNRNVEVAVSPRDYHVFMSLIDSRNQAKRYQIERTANTLLLTNEHGKQQRFDLVN